METEASAFRGPSDSQLSRQQYAKGYGNLSVFSLNFLCCSFVYVFKADIMSLKCISV